MPSVLVPTQRPESLRIRVFHDGIKEASWSIGSATCRAHFL